MEARSRYDLYADRDHDLMCVVDYRNGGDVRVYLRHKSERGSRPFWVHHGHGCLGHLEHVAAFDATRVAEFVARVRPALDRVAASYSDEWDGSNLIGTVDEEARDRLIEEIREAAWWIDLGRAYEDAGVWEAEDWLAPADLEGEYGLSAATTDEELAAIARRIRGDADELAVLVDGLDDYLDVRRAEARDKEMENDQ